MEPPGELTMLLNASADGDREAFDQVFQIVYSKLRRIAHNRMQHERPGHTLSTTALVNEAYMKLVDLDRIQYNGHAHFFAVAAQAMRNILVSYAHRRNAIKRGGDHAKLPLDEVVVLSDERAEEVLALDEALQRLKALDERRHQVVECRFFGGMSIEETAAALKISPATVKRDWNLARAWLNRELRSDIVRE
jgi:RNA polymerase sigma factor (TIGR02999 family)